MTAVLFQNILEILFKLFTEITIINCRKMYENTESFTEFLFEGAEASATPHMHMILKFPPLYLPLPLVNQLAVITLLSQYDSTVPG